MPLMQPMVAAFSVVCAGVTINSGLGENRHYEVSRANSRQRLLPRTAMVLALAPDTLQIFVFPLFAEGAFSPADDVLDVLVAAVLVSLLGWHWEFLPAFAAELVPGMDLVPFWTMAVANVYRKWKQKSITEENRD